MTWTPGPWKMVDLAGELWVAHPETGRYVAKMHTFDTDGLADARLIAAAPEMAEMLEEVSGYSFPSLDVIERLEALLDRIRGAEVTT